MYSNTEIVDSWHRLTQSEQAAYIAKANFLLERQYIVDPLTPKELGFLIYEKEKLSDDTSSN
jgi:hypothetical protein